jgi:hypothetical protein
MISSNSFVAGRIYSLVYSNDVNMVAKRQLDADTIAKLQAAGVTLTAHTTKANEPTGKQLNPLDGQAVTVRRVSSVTAAGGETWERFKARNGIVTGESTRKPWYAESTDNNCIVIGTSANTLGRKYLRGLPQGVTKEQYYIGDREATPAETLTIQAFKEGTGGADFVLLNLDSLLNVQDVTA